MEGKKTLEEPFLTTLVGGEPVKREVSATYKQRWTSQ